MTNRNQIQSTAKEAVDLTVNTELKRQPNEHKTLKKQKLRNNEYYEMQSMVDELYAKSKEGKTFNKLMELIACENNILLAYRNIKKNKGSTTKGTDGLDITHYADWGNDKFIAYFQNKLQNYHPKSVRRVEIPKPDGRMRPLGIPCMDDRIIQQCILQVLEPICEAKFHKHSYGFRPNRATSHAISRTEFLMWRSGLHYVVDIDIKGFFDNVNHSKLMKQLWSLGIRDKNLLCVIGKILKSEIQGEGIPEKGTPQGGIISPLLSNVVLNELDWWLSDQWETFETRHSYAQHKYRALKTTNLKEFFFVRYADDFKILCKDYKTAQKIYVAARDWLKERLGLEINPEKSKITNVRKGRTEFLGFALYVKKSKGKFITRSNISEKAKQAITKNLKEQIKSIQKNSTADNVNLLNSKILGVHNYYRYATLCSRDFGEINFVVSKSLHNRLKGRTKKIKGKERTKHHIPDNLDTEHKYYTKTYRKLYGGYNQKPKIISGIAVFPIYGCKYKSSKNFTQDTCSYTPLGREIIHKKLANVNALISYLLSNKDYDNSTEYNDNRISLIAGQNGKCAITKQPLEIGQMECHHKKPKSLGGTDEYKNLVWLDSKVHKLIHATSHDTINNYLKQLNLDEKMLKKVNSLRILAENLEITTLI